MAKITAVNIGKNIESMGVMDYGRMWGYRDEFGDEVWLPKSLVDFIQAQGSEHDVGAREGSGGTARHG